MVHPGTSWGPGGVWREPIELRPEDCVCECGGGVVGGTLESFHLCPQPQAGQRWKGVPSRSSDARR